MYGKTHSKTKTPRREAGCLRAIELYASAQFNGSPGMCSVQEFYECESVEMKRDMDLVRDLLLGIERDPQFDGTRMLSPTKPEDFGITNHSMEEVSYHLALIVEAGFVSGKSAGLRIGTNVPVISKLTWQGHEFVDDIKDSGVWESTKSRLAGLPGVAIAIVAEIAKAEIKKKLGLT